MDAGDNYYSDHADGQVAVHNTSQRPTSRQDRTMPRLPKEVWEKLSDDARETIRAWNHENHPNGRPKVTGRKVNLHDIAGYLDVTDGQDTYEDVDAVDCTGEVNNGVITNNTGEALEDQLGLNNDSTEILAHITKQQALPPDNNIRTLLASTHNHWSVNNMQLPLHRKSNGGDKQKEHIVLNGK